MPKPIKHQRPRKRPRKKRKRQKRSIKNSRRPLMLKRRRISPSGRRTKLLALNHQPKTKDSIRKKPKRAALP